MYLIKLCPQKKIRVTEYMSLLHIQKQKDHHGA